MPGMMDTVLNIGLSSKTIPGLLKKTNNPRFVWDSYRRLIMMYADVVMEKAEGIEPVGGGIRKQLDGMHSKISNLSHRLRRVLRLFGITFSATSSANPTRQPLLNSAIILQWLRIRAVR